MDSIVSLIHGLNLPQIDVEPNRPDSSDWISCGEYGFSEFTGTTKVVQLFSHESDVAALRNVVHKTTRLQL